MNLKRLNLLFVLFISAIIYTAIPVCAQENVVTNPVITELNDNFYIHSEYGKNVYIENEYYQNFLLTSQENRKLLQEKIENKDWKKNVDYK